MIRWVYLLLICFSYARFIKSENGEDGSGEENDLEKEMALEMKETLQSEIRNYFV